MYTLHKMFGLLQWVVKAPYLNHLKYIKYYYDYFVFLICHRLQFGSLPFPSFGRELMHCIFSKGLYALHSIKLFCVFHEIQLK